MTTVAISNFAGAGWQFFDNNGVPLSGGLIHSYAAGTTTPQNTYTTYQGNVAHTNPIILDSAGRVPNEVWLDVSLMYKFVLATSSDVTIATYDNLSGTAQASDLINFEADLANTTNVAKGDALVGFRQSNSSGALGNAVGSTVHKKLQESISVKDFGATGNGTTDDTTAIQNALNALGSNGGRLHFPAGTYKITSTITPIAATWKELILFGDGGQTTINSTHNGKAFDITNGNTHIENMVFLGPGKTYTSSIGVNGNFTIGTILNCRFSGYYNGINIDNTIMAVIDRCEVSGCEVGISAVTTNGVFMNLIDIRGSYVSGCNIGINAYNWYASNIYNTVFEYCLTYGGTMVGMKSVNMNAVWCEGNPTADMLFTDSLVDFQNCRFSSGQPKFVYTSGWAGLPTVRTNIGSGILTTGYVNLEAYNGTDNFTTMMKMEAFTDHAGVNTTTTKIGNPLHTDAIQLWNMNPNVGGGVYPGQDGLLCLDVTSAFNLLNLELYNSQYPNSGNPTIAFSNWGAGNSYSPKLLASWNTILFEGGGGYASLGSGYFGPKTDGGPTLGYSSQRWNTVYAVTGTINTSDRNEKQQIRELSDAEKLVATEIKTLIRAFKFNDAVAQKGDKARIHFGVIAQDVQDAFTKHGLNADEYGLFCEDTWNEYDGKSVPVDEDGKFVVTTYTVKDEIVMPDKDGKFPDDAIKHVEKFDTVKKTRLGVRYEELLSFVIGAM